MARKTKPKPLPIPVAKPIEPKPEPQPEPVLPPFDRLLLMYDEERYIRRLRGDGDRLNKDTQFKEIKTAQRALWAMLTGAEQAKAMGQNWRASPEVFDNKDAEFDAVGFPIENRPPKYWYDIPSFPRAHYTIDVDWEGVERQLKHYAEAYGLNLDPDFQREHVWTRQQQTAYIEYQLQGGEVGKTLIFNHPNWSRHTSEGEELTIVDGKQRLEAVRAFMRNEVRAFGRFRNQWAGGRMDMFRAGFKFSVVEMRTRADLYRLYLNINAGGTPHTADELNKVRAMLAAELEKKTDGKPE